jgi:hypothetical protein
LRSRSSSQTEKRRTLGPPAAKHSNGLPAKAARPPLVGAAESAP